MVPQKALNGQVPKPRFAYSIGLNHKTNGVKNYEFGSWAEGIDHLLTLPRDAEKQGRHVCPPFEGEIRKGPNVEFAWQLVLDLDEIPDAQLPAVKEWLNRHRCAYWTTHSHGLPGKGNRLRVLIDLTRPVNRAELACIGGALVAEFHKLFAGFTPSPNSFKLEQVGYLPPPAVDVVVNKNEPPIDVDALLALPTAVPVVPIYGAKEGGKPTITADKDPVYNLLKVTGKLRGGKNKPGWFNIKCLFGDHSPGVPSSTTYALPTDGYSYGAFSCQHETCKKLGRKTRDFLMKLGLDPDITWGTQELLADGIDIDALADIDIGPDTPFERTIDTRPATPIPAHIREADDGPPGPHDGPSTDPRGTPPTPPAKFPPPYPGVMADLVAERLRTAVIPQPALTLGAVLVAMSAGVGPAYAFRDEMRCNVYALGVSGTGTGKDAVRRGAEMIAKEAGALLMGEHASGEGLEDSLVEGQSCFSSIDEIGHSLAAITAKGAASYQQKYGQMLLKLFSVSQGTYIARIRASTKEGKIVEPHVIEHPYFCVYGATTAEKLSTAVSAANIEDGLLGRMLYIPGQENLLPRMLDDGKFVMPEAVAEFKRKKADASATAFEKNWQDCVTTIHLPRGALVAIHECAVSAAKRGQDSPFAKALSTRTAEKAKRIAGVLAVWENPKNPTVTMAHVEWARQFAEASEAALLYFANGEMYASDTQANAIKVMKSIDAVLKYPDARLTPVQAEAVAKGWAPRNLVLKHSKLSTEEVTAATHHLIAEGAIAEIGEKTWIGRNQISKYLRRTYE